MRGKKSAKKYIFWLRNPFSPQFILKSMLKVLRRNLGRGFKYFVKVSILHSYYQVSQMCKIPRSLYFQVLFSKAHFLSSIWRKFLKESFFQKFHFFFLEIPNKKENNEACNICFEVRIYRKIPSKTFVKKMITNDHELIS